MPAYRTTVWSLLSRYLEGWRRFVMASAVAVSLCLNLFAPLLAPERAHATSGVEVFKTGVSFSAQGDTVTTISWSTLSQYKPTDFKVKFDTKNQDLTKAQYPAGSQLASQFSYTITGLTPGTNYYAKVTYIGQGEDGAQGTDVSEFATTGINPVTGKPADPVGGGAGGAGTVVGVPDATFPDCLVNPDKAGVLIEHQITGATGNRSVFGCYTMMVLSQNMPYVLILATALIILSGIQYMLSGGSAGELTKAKQRIAGILGGIILYFLIRFLVPVIATGLSI